MAYRKIERPFDLDELAQHFRDGMLYMREELPGGCVSYTQLLKWAGVSRLYRNGVLYLEVRE